LITAARYPLCHRHSQQKMRGRSRISRAEGISGRVAKDFHAEIVISEDLYRAATQIPDASIERRNDMVTEVTIRGRAQPILVRIVQCELGQLR
jgi:hypothetical protein